MKEERKEQSRGFVIHMSAVKEVREGTFKTTGTLHIFASVKRDVLHVSGLTLNDFVYHTGVYMQKVSLVNH